MTNDNQDTKEQIFKNLQSGRGEVGNLKKAIRNCPTLPDIAIAKIMNQFGRVDKEKDPSAYWDGIAEIAKLYKQDAAYMVGANLTPYTGAPEKKFKKLVQTGSEWLEERLEQLE